MQKNLIILIVFLLSIGGAGLAGIGHGMKLKNAEWLEKDAKQRDKLAVELGKAMQRVADKNEKTEINLLEAINERDETINRLHSDLGAVSRVRFSVKKPVCDANAVRGQAEDSSVNAQPAGESGIRITGGVYQDVRVSEQELSDKLWRLYEERETLKAYFKALKIELEGVAEVVE